MGRVLRTRLLLSLAVLLMTTLSYSAEHEAVDADKIMASTGFKIDREKLMQSELLVFARGDKENVDSEIALDMLLYLDAPYEAVLKELQKGENQLSDYSDAIAVKVDDLDDPSSALSKLHFSPDEQDEVDRLMAYDEGDSFNFSEAEIKRLHLLRAHATSKKESAESFMREVLAERMKAYHKRGVHSIAAYERGHTVHIDKDLKKGSQDLQVLKRWFDYFYEDFLHYPDVKDTHYTQKFYWVKDAMEGRPVFILKHQMVHEQPGATVIAERQFYISHGLDGLQVEIICMPYKGGTILGMGAQTFTGKVAGMGGLVAHKIGRMQMEKELRPMFVNLQRKFAKK